MQSETLKRIVTEMGTPVFVYDQKILADNLDRIQAAMIRSGLKNRVDISITYFTNSQPNLFKFIVKKGAGILLQTPEEYYQLKRYNLHKKVSVSPSFLSNSEIDFWMDKGVVNLASLEEVYYSLEKHRTRPLSFRIDISPGSTQRTGIKRWELSRLRRLFNAYHVSPYSFHAYIGTSSTVKGMRSAVRRVLELYKKYFPDVKYINLGGGFSFDYDAKATEKKHFDWYGYFSYLHRMITRYNIPESTKFIIEPGRDIFADTGELILMVKRIIPFKGRFNIATTGSYVYIPSATIKKRQHQCLFFDTHFRKRIPHRPLKGVLSGSTTLSTDYVLPHDLVVPENIATGWYIVIRDVGAYGATQHMEFLNKAPAPEVLVLPNGGISIVAWRGRFEDKIRNVLRTPKYLRN